MHNETEKVLFQPTAELVSSSLVRGGSKLGPSKLGSGSDTRGSTELIDALHGASFTFGSWSLPAYGELPTASTRGLLQRKSTLTDKVGPAPCPVIAQVCHGTSLCCVCLLPYPHMLHHNGLFAAHASSFK